MATELFNVSFRPGINEPPLMLLCQAVDMGNEKFVWVDGINAEQPVMIPLASLKQIQWVGSFKEFMQSRMVLAAQVIEEGKGEQSATILARAMLYMSRDKSLSAKDAINTAIDQALDIIDQDNQSAREFSVAFEGVSA